MWFTSCGVWCRVCAPAGMATGSPGSLRPPLFHPATPPANRAPVCSGARSVLEEVLERHAPFDARLARHAEHALTHDVALDLVGAAVDRRRLGEQRGLQEIAVVGDAGDLLHRGDGLR